MEENFPYRRICAILSRGWPQMRLSLSLERERYSRAIGPTSYFWG